MKRKLIAIAILAAIFVTILAAHSLQAADTNKAATATFTSQRPQNLWKQTAPQLARFWRGKTREQLLYQVPIVSSKDRIVRGEGKVFYALVEYYKDKEFRKFLFQGKDPQLFITAAATAADVLAVNKKYAINIGLSQELFKQAYANQATEEKDLTLPAGSVLYKLAYTDINTPQAQDHWFLFENGSLTQTFYTESEKDKYISSLEPTSADTPKTTPQKTTKPTVRKALISGGTAWDQAYLPRVVNYQPAFQTPKLSQEK